MKLPATLIMLMIYTWSNAQSTAEARAYIDSLQRKDSTNNHGRDSMLVSYQALNVFFARKVNTYLSAAGDLSLFNRYAIIDPGDRRLFIGQNFAKKPWSGEKRTKHVFTTGLEASTKDGFSEIYSANNFSTDIGLSLKYTWLGRGVVRYDNTRQSQKAMHLAGVSTQIHKSRMNTERKILKNQVLAKMTDKETKFINSISIVTDPAHRNALLKEFYDDLNRNTKKEYVEGEADILEERQYYHWFRDHWISLQAYIPFTKTIQTVAPDVLSPLKEEELYNFNVKLLFNMIREWKKGKIFLHAGAVLKNNSNVYTEALSKVNIAQYRALGGTDTLQLAQLKTSEVFIGQYNTFLSPGVRGQVVYFPAIKNKQVAGISALIEKDFGDYDPLNFRLGIPFTLTGKNPDSPVTFELQGKWSDIKDSVNPDKTLREKFTFGISVGIPLSSKIY